MKADSELKITIIGLGNLMEEIFPCISRTLGETNLKAQVNATTVDEADYRQKAERLGINVYLNDNQTALKSLEPDIIFFAPPPSVAPSLIEGDLKDYFSYLREKGASLPAVFAFPPVPDGPAYRKVLGDDLLIIRILPSALKSIGGVPIQGTAMATADIPWPEDRMEQVRRIWSHMGGLLELKPDQLLKVLGGGVICHATPEMVLLVSDLLEESGQPVDYPKIASCMRGYRQEATGFSRPESLPCAIDDVPSPLRETLGGIINAWSIGVTDYMKQIDLAEGLGDMMMTAMLDQMLWLAQAESRKTINAMTSVSATKGGVLEKALLIMESDLKPTIRAAMTSSDNTWQTQLQQQVKDTADRVFAHGQALNQ